MLRIRLTRTGKKHQPTYRIVVAEHSAPIKGKFIEILGYYLPIRNPKVLEVNAERVNYWISQGAQATDTVHNLLVDKGVLTDKRNIKYAKITPTDPEAKAEDVHAPKEEAAAEAPEESTATDETEKAPDVTPEKTENPPTE